jgi:putative FmdB family regulatory protein
MPIYDYRCTRCGLEVEVSHAIGGPGPAACASCGGPMKKALTAPAIHFKGSGWAKKDARAASTPAPAKGKDAAESGAAERPASPDGSTPATTDGRSDAEDKIAAATAQAKVTKTGPSTSSG